MKNTFINAWEIAVNLFHNKQMESLNNPTPEVMLTLHWYRNKLKKLKGWASIRWGDKHIGQLIYERLG